MVARAISYIKANGADKACTEFTTGSTFNLETAVGRARVGCDGARWQGATTTRGIPPLEGATPPACASAAQSGA